VGKDFLLRAILKTSLPPGARIKDLSSAVTTYVPKYELLSLLLTFVLFYVTLTL